MTERKKLTLEEEASMYEGYIVKSIEKGEELDIYKRICEGYLNIDENYNNRVYYHMVDYMLDSYNTLKKCMKKDEAKKVSMKHGIERIIAEYRNKNRNI